MLTWPLLMDSKISISTFKSMRYMRYFMYIEHNHRVADQIEE
jgi:hypothetical protein